MSFEDVVGPVNLKNPFVKLLDVASKRNVDGVGLPSNSLYEII